MNMNQITTMFTRLVMRRIMNWGINKGLNGMSKARKSGPAGQPPQTGSDGKPVQAQDRQGDAQQRKQARDMARKMRTLSRMMRR